MLFLIILTYTMLFFSFVLNLKYIMCPKKRYSRYESRCKCFNSNNGENGKQNNKYLLYVLPVFNFKSMQTVRFITRSELLGEFETSGLCEAGNSLTVSLF